jgi:hypothetical protein
MPQGVHTGMLVSGGSTISISDVSFNFGNIGLHWNGKHPLGSHRRSSSIWF